MSDGAARRRAAALPVEIVGGAPRVALITSRDTGRWLVPKGGIAHGETAAACAEREAREEAGVIGRAGRKPVAWITARPGGLPELPLFLLWVDMVLDDWPEQHQRRRIWGTPASASLLVDDPALVAVLRFLAGPWVPRWSPKAGEGAGGGPRSAALASPSV